MRISRSNKGLSGLIRDYNRAQADPRHCVGLNKEEFCDSDPTDVLDMICMPFFFFHNPRLNGYTNRPKGFSKSMRNRVTSIATPIWGLKAPFIIYNLLDTSPRSSNAGSCCGTWCDERQWSTPPWVTVVSNPRP